VSHFTKLAATNQHIKFWKCLQMNIDRIMFYESNLIVHHEWQPNCSVHNHLSIPIFCPPLLSNNLLRSTLPYFWRIGLMFTIQVTRQSFFSFLFFLEHITLAWFASELKSIQQHSWLITRSVSSPWLDKVHTYIIYKHGFNSLKPWRWCEENERISVTICLEGLADVVAFYWLTSMVENNP